MKTLSPTTKISAAVLGAFLLTPLAHSAAHAPAMAASAPAAKAKDMTAPAGTATAPASTMAKDRPTFSDRENMKAWSGEKEQLERELKVGEGKDFYRKALADKGYQVTSVNKESATKSEFEIVKGNHSYEVQIDFDKAGKASKVDVTTNMWRAASTKAAMRGNKVAGADKYVKGNEAYSDSDRMKTWTGEKDKLEKSLALGKEKGYYAAELKKMGYQVTSVNDNDKDHVEYEIVKGSDSYEVQIGFEAGKAKKIDVTTNMWESDATEKALATKGKK